MAAIVPDVEAIENDVDNVTEARSKLEDILNGIVDKNDDGRNYNGEQDATKKSIHDQLPPYTPTKRTQPGRSGRKKRKKDFLYDDLELSNKPSYIIKVFDRRVNLAKFHENTPLYVMLREWMKNKPFTSHVSLVEDEEMLEVEETSKDEGESCKEAPVYELPKPIKCEESHPRPLPPALKTALVEDIIDTKENIESLKKDNMFRWRKVRNRWKEHSLRQQQRHLQSIIILKSMMTSTPSPTHN